MTPLYLKLENFFSHRQSEIDFSQFNSALLIGNVNGDYDISNGSGKSSVFEGLLWCLFNKSRVSSISDIVMWGENECMATLIFSHEENLYRIRRLRSRVSNTSTVYFDIKDEDGSWMDISGSTSKLTNEEIESRIRFNYKTFINSAYFRQNDISEFAESDPGKRKEILKSIIDISKWDEYEKEAKTRLRSVRSDAKVLEAICEDYDSLTEDIIEYEELLKEVNSSAIKSSKERNSLEKSIEQLEREYNETKKNLDTAQWDRVVDETSKLKRDLTLELSKKKMVEMKAVKAKKEVESILSENEKLSESAEKIILIDNADKLLEVSRDEMSEHKAELSLSTDRLSELEHTHIHEGECYVCGHNISSDIYNEIKSKHDESITTYERKQIFAKNKIKEISDKISTYERSIRDRRKKASYLSTIDGNIIKLDYAKKHFNEMKDNFSELKDNIEKIELRIKTNESILASLKDENFNDLRRKIESSKKKKSMLDVVLQKVNRDVGIYSEKVKNARVRLEKMEDSRRDLLVLLDKADVLGNMVKMLGKNGIQTILLNSVIQDLENTCNKTLASICNEPFEVIIETQRVGSDGISMVDTLDLRVKKDGIVQHFKSLSGGEKFRVSLALRIALSEISSRHGGSSLEFLLLDEINSPLDRHGIDTLFINVIKALEDRYKIIVITHDDTLKEKFDSILDVSKADGESTVNFIRR